MHSATTTKTTRMMGVPQGGVHSRGSSPMKRDVLETETATVKPWRTLKAAHVAWIHEKEKAHRTSGDGEDGDDYVGVDDCDDNIDEDGDDSPHSCEGANCQSL